MVCDPLRNTAEGSAPSKWVQHLALLRSQLQQLILPERRNKRHFPQAMQMPVGRYARKLPAPKSGRAGYPASRRTCVERVMPGDRVEMEIELITPIAIERTLRFAIREGGRTVGAGVVSEILK